ncbi:hypothetical protein CXF83_21800 [Shewanella sp. Choline-02u-19]|uniref:hypothetical protein n=1 Tax=unclassified Shewanella TaxID=196818 RepID=UPI000C32E68F|nr:MULTISPECIES: hypothetical protein [unclassified Shewanella]PKH60393.1 hypothetical protein CXF84_02605 [Shewanella sp. Bg11-22]PKI29152.1 hypothetical protein CXF83_21800 [Shewanella sp. Choline-02u-19]
MKTTKLSIRNNEYTLPDTCEMSITDFNDISHDITENISKRLVDKYGNYSCKFGLTHNEVSRNFFSKSRGVEYKLTGGLDMSLEMICNFTKRASGITRLKDACRNSNTKTPWLPSIEQRFREVLLDIKSESSSRNMPIYYTGAIKHLMSKTYLPNAVAMIIELEECCVMYVIIGTVEFEFEFNVEQNLKSNLSKAHHTVTSLSLSNVDDDLFDDYLPEVEEVCLLGETINRISVQSSCEVHYEVEQDETNTSLDKSLEDVIASLDDEHEKMTIAELSKQQRIKNQRNSYAGHM